MAFQDVIETVKNEATDALEIAKIKTKVGKEKTNIKKNYEKIGEMIYEKYQMGGAGEEIDAIIKEITDSKTLLKEYQEKIEKIKTVK